MKRPIKMADQIGPQFRIADEIGEHLYNSVEKAVQDMGIKSLHVIEMVHRYMARDVLRQLAARHGCVLQDLLR